MQKFVFRLENWLLNPLRRVTNDPLRTSRSRLLSAILLMLLFTGAIVITLVLNADLNDIHEPTVMGAFVLLVIIAGVYIVNRLGYTSVAALGLILPFAIIFIYIPFYSGENPLFLAFLLIPILLTAIFFSLRWTSAMSVFILIVVLVHLSTLDQISKTSSFWNLRNIWYFLFMMVGLLLTFMWHLGNLEKIRREELKRINAELEQKVAEMERFTYTVSHELKNPVVTIKGFLGSVDKDMQTGNYQQAQKDFHRIANAAEYLHSTITDLLELSRIGRITNQSDQFPLSEIIEEASERMTEQLRSNQVTLNVQPGLPMVHGDRKRLREVYENLISNAVKYMGDQEFPMIEIGVREAKEPIYYVRDNGLGIETKYQEKIFGLFEKLNPTSEGTGIGLALSKRIIETHGGEIWVESEGLGKGSAFCFTIPENGKSVQA